MAERSDIDVPDTDTPDTDVEVLGYEVAPWTLEQATTWCLAAVRTPEPKLLVTLNPEIIVQAQTSLALEEALQAADLTVADGIGVLWAARRFGHSLPERVPGVELVTNVLERGGADLRVYFLGARPGVAARAAELAERRYGITVAGVQHGYFRRPDETPDVVARIAAAQPHLLLAGLGEGQERFLHQHRHDLGVPLLIGVGGALDVIAGQVKRTPGWTRRLRIEWMYRVGLDPKRWHRVPRLVRFVGLVREARRPPRER
ncbi:MAG: WecB/TagA/CpsF family glycosyltransferase [Trueperaceae bacterium]|nr:WecB/TagA/CpsF family glycosyltransferase [Trueperaceae bacterium]